MICNRVKLEGMQMLITCAHCKKPKADTKLSHMRYDSYETNVI